MITLILIAQELNVDIINIVDIENQKIIDILNKNIETINKEINELQNTLAWHWANATDDDKKLYKEKNKEI